MSFTFVTATLPTMTDARHFCQALGRSFPEHDLIFAIAPEGGQAEVTFSTKDQVVAVAAHTLATAPPDWATWQAGLAWFAS